jgi:hypothetical protein
MDMGLGIPQPGRIASLPLRPKDREPQRDSKERGDQRREWLFPTTFPASAMFQVDGGNEDELALLFTEDLSINANTTDPPLPSQEKMQRHGPVHHCYSVYGVLVHV